MTCLYLTDVTARLISLFSFSSNREMDGWMEPWAALSKQQPVRCRREALPIETKTDCNYPYQHEVQIGRERELLSRSKTSLTWQISFLSQPENSACVRSEISFPSLWMAKLWLNKTFSTSAERFNATFLYSSSSSSRKGSNRVDLHRLLERTMLVFSRMLWPSSVWRLSRTSDWWWLWRIRIMLHDSSDDDEGGGTHVGQKQQPVSDRRRKFSEETHSLFRSRRIVQERH